MTACLEEGPPRIYGDGEQTRDFICVVDAVRANLLAADAPRAAGSVCNVAAGARTSLNRLLDEIRRLTGAQVEAIHGRARDGRRARQPGRPRAGARAARLRAARELQQGLRRTVEQLRSQRRAEGEHS